MTTNDYRRALANLIEKIKTEPKSAENENIIKGMRIAFNLTDQLEGVDKSEDTLMTNVQLAELLSRGFGQSILEDKENHAACSVWNYFDEDYQPVPENVKIRQWGSDKWLYPTVDIYEKYFEGMPKVQLVENLL